MLALRKAISTFAQLAALAERVRLLPAPEPNRADHPYAGTIIYQGLVVYVENPKGSTRSGTAPNGTRWSVRMPAHYGEFAGTLGMDGDPVDVFVGDDPDAPDAFVVHQKVPGTQRPDEDKVILGVRTAAEAKALFMAAYTKPGFFHGMTRWSLADLRAHLLEGRAPGTRLDLPPHLTAMVKAAHSSWMLRALLKNVQLSLFGGPTPVKHTKVVTVRGHVRRDGSVVPSHVRHVLVDDIEEHHPAPPPEPTPQERYLQELARQREAAGVELDVFAPDDTAAAWMRDQAAENLRDTWEERGRQGAPPQDLRERVEATLRDNHARFAAAYALSSIERLGFLGHHRPERRAAADVVSRAVNDVFESVAKRKRSREATQAKLDAARAMQWAEPVPPPSFGGRVAKEDPFSGIEESLDRAFRSEGSNLAFAIRLAGRRVATERADRMIAGTNIEKTDPVYKQFVDESYKLFAADVKDYLLLTAPLRIRIYEAANAALQRIDQPLSPETVAMFDSAEDASAFAWGIAEQSRFHQPTIAARSVDRAKQANALRHTLDEFAPDGVRLGHWGRAISANPVAWTTAVYGDKGVLHPSDKGFQPMTKSHDELQPKERLEGLGRYALAQTMMERFGRDEHPTLWRGMIVSRAAVDRLSSGDTLPLTACTAFTFIQSVAEHYSSNDWAKRIAEDTHGSDTTPVILHLTRSAEFDKTVAGWHPRHSDPDMQRSAFEIVTAAHGFRVTRKVQRHDGVWEIHGEGVP